MPLTPEERKRAESYSQRPLLAVLATVNRDGSPQLTPVWYDFDGTYFNITTVDGRVKVRNLRRDSRAVLCVVDTTSGFGQPMIVRGRAEFTPEGAAEKFRSHARFYRGKDRAEPYATQTLARNPRLVLRITPERITFGG
ncbi:MAG: PPOX class F420-dependent oxidoreductase [Chloroflexi bacterium]|nr:PPOX class F420-dependent oxidoreductase [Chloroflexota bacterium]